MCALIVVFGSLSLAICTRAYIARPVKAMERGMVRGRVDALNSVNEARKAARLAQPGDHYVCSRCGVPVLIPFAVDAKKNRAKNVVVTKRL